MPQSEKLHLLKKLAWLPMQPFFQRHKVLLIHALFWCVYASFFLYQISFSRKGEEPDWDRIFKDGTFHVIAVMSISYLNYFVFLHRFFQHRSIGRYFLEFALPFGLLVYGVIKGKQFIIDGCTHTERWVYSQRFAINVTVSVLFIVIFVSMLKFLEEWFKLEAQKKEVENEKLTAELRFLKAQINPHFLFNTLNNLYYLAFTQSPNTTEVIDKLSQMMRYMIYDSNHAKVPLSKEIDYMENYISLEKLRLNNQVPIDFRINGSTARTEDFGATVQIVPLILITFLENAFKHGVTNGSKDAWVKIQLDLRDNTCFYTVENSKIPKQEGTAQLESSGIGLQNVRRRLDLSYPNQYVLKVEDLPNRYSVHLELNLR